MIDDDDDDDEMIDDEDESFCEHCGEAFDTKNPSGPKGYYADMMHRSCYDGVESVSEEERSRDRDFFRA